MTDKDKHQEKVHIPVEQYPTFEDFARKVITTPKPEKPVKRDKQEVGRDGR